MQPLKRRTVELSEDAVKNMKIISKSLGITQFQLISILLEETSVDEPKLIARAKQINDKSALEKGMYKTLKKKFGDVSMSRIERAMELLQKDEDEKEFIKNNAKDST